MGQTYNPRLRRALMEVVENQLRDGTPPETFETLSRLVAAGYSRENAMELIACVVCSEIFDVLRRNEVYNENRYVAGLRGLPRMPWDGGRAGDSSNVGPTPLSRPANASEGPRKKWGRR
jgi:hypothetical protein